MSKHMMVMVVLVVVLITSAGYFGVDKWNAAKDEKQLEIFQQGAQYGYEQAVIQAVELAITCDPVPFRIENQTLNMIAVDCLQQGGQ